jgi:acid phosphatase family membrane protein YuiD
MAIRQALDGQVCTDSTVTQPARTLIDRAAIKVTIRLAPEAATALATRARAADVSQGHSVAGLLEGSPPPMRPSDHSDAVAALAKSTDALAGLRVDLNALARMVRMAGANGLAGQSADLDSMSKQMLEHIAIAARLIIGLQPSARARRERLEAPRASKRSS